MTLIYATNNLNLTGNLFFDQTSGQFHPSTFYHLKANLRHANLSNDEKKSEGEDFAGAQKAEEEEVRRSVFARNYR